MKATLCYELGIMKMGFKSRVVIAWRILTKKNTSFQVSSSELFHRNHTQRITEIEL